MRSGGCTKTKRIACTFGNELLVTEPDQSWTFEELTLTHAEWSPVDPNLLAVVSNEVSVWDMRDNSTVLTIQER